MSDLSRRAILLGVAASVVATPAAAVPFHKITTQEPLRILARKAAVDLCEKFHAWLLESYDTRVPHNYRLADDQTFIFAQEIRPHQVKHDDYTITVWSFNRTTYTLWVHETGAEMGQLVTVQADHWKL